MSGGFEGGNENENESGEDRGESSGSSPYSDSEVRTISLAIIAGVFFGGLATGVAFPTLPLLGELLGMGALVLGIVLSANRIARLVMNAPAGTVIDRVGARRPMVLGLFVQGLAPFGYVLGLYAPRGAFATLPWVGEVSTPAVVFVLARSLWGIGSAFVFLGAFATISSVTTTANRGRWLGYMRGGQSIGFPGGLALGGVVTDLFSAQTAFLIAGTLAMFAGVVGALVIPDVQPDTDDRSRLRDLPTMVRREPRVLPLGLGNLTIRFVFGGVLLATVVTYAETYGMELALLDAAGISGVVLGTGVLSSSATTLVSGHLSDRLDNRALVTIPALCSMAAGLAVLALVPTLPALFVGVAMIGVGTGGTGPALLAILGDVTPGTEIGRMGSVYNVLGDVGLSTGPLLAVPLVETVLGYPNTYLLCSLWVLATLAMVTVPLLRYDFAASVDTSP